MTDRDRQRRLHVENRLQELNAKLGPIQDDTLPEWLDHMPDPQPQPQPQPGPPEPVPPPPPAPPRRGRAAADW